MLLMWCLNYLHILGSSVVIYKNVQRGIAALFVISEQGMQEVLELKYLTMEEAKRSEQNITAQRHIDQVNIGSIKRTIMKNYVQAFPNSYAHLLEFKTWKELESYVNKLTQENKANEDNVW